VLAMRPHHALEQLFGTSVGPALAMDRAQEAARVVFAHLARRLTGGIERMLAIHLCSRKMNQTNLALSAVLHERQQVREARVDNLERNRRVQGGIAQRRE
jgi:hypothetical protein